MINEFEVKMTPESNWELKFINIFRGISISNNETEYRNKIRTKLDSENHFEIDEKLIKVSQGEETAELPWNQVYKVTGNKKRILIFSNRRNAYILPEEQLGEEFSKVKEIATEVVEKYRLKIK